MQSSMLSLQASARPPVNLKEQLQARLPFDIETVLSSNSLLTGQDAENWTMFLQTFWQILQEDEEA